MATYAIGDLQGCFVTLQALLEKIRFDQAHPRVRDKPGHVGPLARRRVIVVEIVEADDAVARFAQQSLGTVAADKPGSAGYKSGRHGRLPKGLVSQCARSLSQKCRQEGSGRGCRSAANRGRRVLVCRD